MAGHPKQASRCRLRNRFLARGTDGSQITGYRSGHQQQSYRYLRRRIHRARKCAAGVSANLDDYAFLIQGYLDLFEASFDSVWLERAELLSRLQVTYFADLGQGGFFDSSGKDRTVLLRMKSSYDGAEPSGNSVSALNLLRLGRMLNRPEWVETARKTIEAFGSVLESHGHAMPLMLAALDLCLAPPRQLIVAGNRDSADTKILLDQANRLFLPDLQIILADNADNQAFLTQYLDIF